MPKQFPKKERGWPSKARSRRAASKKRSQWLKSAEARKRAKKYLERVLGMEFNEVSASGTVVRAPLRVTSGSSFIKKETMWLPAIRDMKMNSLSDTYKAVNLAVEAVRREGHVVTLDSLGDVKSFTLFERSLWLIAIDKLQMKDAVISALLSNDTFQIRRVLRCSWFFRTVTAAELEESILPFVSVSTRCRIINQMSRHNESTVDAERLLHFALQYYGGKVAEMLLPRCSVGFIEFYLRSRHPRFDYNTSSSVLVRICKRKPELVVTLVDYVFADAMDPDVDRGHFLLFVARYHPLLFLKLLRKKHRSIGYASFGYSQTKRLAALGKWSDFLHGRFNLGGVLSAADRAEKVQFLSSMVQRINSSRLCLINWTASRDELLETVQRLPLMVRRQLLEDTYQQVFKANLWDNKAAWNPGLLKLLPMDRRQLCVEAMVKGDNKPQAGADKLDLETVPEELLVVLSCGQVIPHLKKLISNEKSHSKRSDLLQLMVKNCAANKDLVMLEEVIGHICARHRNEAHYILNSLVEDVFQQFKHQQFTQGIWNHVMELATINAVNSGYIYNYLEWFEHYLEFLLKNRLPTDKEITKVVQMWLGHGYSYSMGFLRDYKLPHFREAFFLYYDALVKQLKQGSYPEDSLTEIVKGIIESTVRFNRNHRSKISMQSLTYLTDVISILMENSTKEDLREGGLLSSLLSDPYLTQLHLKKYFNPTPPPLSDDIAVYEGMFHYWYARRAFMRIRYTFSFLGLTERMRRAAADKFKTQKSSQDKIKTLKMYSFFGDVQELEQLVQEYIPSEEETKVGYTVDEADLVKLQVQVPTVIRNLHPASRNFPLIFKFFKGDFLKPTLPSFFTACYNSPLPHAMDTLLRAGLEGPVAPKKQLLNIVGQITTLPHRLVFYNKQWGLQKHHSVRQVILRNLATCLKEDPTLLTFDILAKCLRECDDVVFETRPPVRKIPEAYILDYTTLVCDYINRLRATREAKAVEFTDRLLSELVASNGWLMKILNDELCWKLLEQYLYVNGSQVSSQTLHEFAWYYAVTSSDARTTSRRTSDLLDLMEQRRDNKKAISLFIQHMLLFTLSKSKGDFIVDEILERWPRIYSKCEAVSTLISLRCISMYNNIAKETNGGDILYVSTELGKQVRHFVTSHAHNMELKTIICRGVSDALKTLQTHNKPVSELLVVRELISEEPDTVTAIMATLLLSYHKINDVELEGTETEEPATLLVSANYSYMVRRLEAMQNDIVLTYVNVLLKRMK